MSLLSKCIMESRSQCRGSSSHHHDFLTVLSTAQSVLSPSSSPPEEAAIFWTRVVRSPTPCIADLGLATGKSSSATAASSSYICAPICSVCQLRLYVAIATQCAGTCSSSFTHQNRLASHFGTSSNATDSSCVGTRRMRNIFLKISQKAPVMPDVSCLLLTPAHLSLAPFLI